MGSLSDDDDPESIQRSEGIEEKHIKKTREACAYVEIRCVVFQ